MTNTQQRIIEFGLVIAFLVLAFLAVKTNTTSCSICRDHGETNKSKHTEEGLAWTGCTMSFSNEPGIDLFNHPMPEDYGDFVISQFTVNTRASVVRLPFFNGKISKYSLCKLKSEADDLFVNNGTDEYVSALKVNYGLSFDGDSVILFYQPVALKKVTSNPGSGTADFAIVEASPVKYYRNINDSLIVLGNNAVADTCFRRYETRMKIIKQTNGAKEFLNTTDGHAKSVTYCFQEIWELMSQNDGGYVYSWNCIKKISTAPFDSLHYHDVILGPIDLDGPQLTDFYLKYANMGHLCPPSCGVVDSYIRFQMQ